MLMAWQSSGQSAYWHTGDAEYNSSSNGGATSIGTEVTTANSGGNHGNRFINNLVVSNRGSCVFAYNTSNSSNIYYFNADSTAEYLPFFSRGTHPKNSTNQNGNQNLSGNTWLKTCWTSYSTSGGGGAGQGTGGTQITYGGANWGLFPFNMSGNYSPNWGTCIDPYYDSQTSNNIKASTRNDWRSAHNAGWGQSLALWVKVP
jgi:hypothetical protein